MTKDDLIARIEILEREGSMSFDRWHDERRKRERLEHDVDLCLQMLLSEPDTQGGLFRAENILREALVRVKHASP